YPFVPPPDALAAHLLTDKQSWQLADAGWSPDFTEASQDALRLYANESGDTNIDGVIAVTTYGIDGLLRATGPIKVDAYGVTVKPGDTTLTALENTRAPATPGADRKAFLDAFAGQLIDSLLALPPHKWPDVLTSLQIVGGVRSAMIWLRDPTEQALIKKFGWDGGLADAPGDYVYTVFGNVAPVSKLDLVTDRRQELNVEIDRTGLASHSLRITWQNTVLEKSAAAYRAIPQNGTERIL